MHYVTALSDDLNDGVSICFQKDGTLHFVHHLDQKVSSFALAPEMARAFANAVVEAHVGAFSKTKVDPEGEAVRLASELSRIAMRVIGYESKPAGWYDEVRENLSKEFCLTLKRRWSA